MTYYRDSLSAREANITYHLVPSTYWDTSKSAEWYTPEAYEADEFIHCTNGIDQLVDVANMFYVPDAREFRVLVLDMGNISCDIRYDDDAQLFPHIYGPLNTSAVIGEFPVIRAEDGSFLAITQ